MKAARKVEFALVPNSVPVPMTQGTALVSQGIMMSAKAAKRPQTAVLFLIIGLVPASLCAKEGFVPVGVAKADITPDYPIRLSGYGNRSAESEGIEQRLWAKAIAIGSDEDDPIVLITVDNCGVPAAMTEEVANRLRIGKGIAPERIAICSTHTHSAPMITGVLPLLFGEPIPDSQQRRIARYTRELTNHLEAVALEALANRQLATLGWNIGSVSFAINRRSQKKGSYGPVDHSLRTLRVVDDDGKLLAIVVRYTCHAVTMFGDFNRVCGDWPGYAQESIEQNHPGCIAMVTIGCAGDQKPNRQSKLEFAKEQGRAIATEVDRLLRHGSFKSVSGSVDAKLEWIDLPFETPPTREELLVQSRQSDRAGFYAKTWLKRLDDGETIPTSLSYPVQTWTFGNDMVMVNLAGEVVVDYAVRLDQTFDASRLWVNAYTNDVPCYIPSRQVLREGGYEPDRSMLSYDQPARFAPEIEKLILDAVDRMVPEEFHSR